MTLACTANTSHSPGIDYSFQHLKANQRQKRIPYLEWFWDNVSLVTGERLNRCAALILLGVSLAVSAHGQGRELNHISERAVQLVKEAVLLAEADKPLAAIRAVKTARLISPNYLRAHIEYQNIKTNYLDQYDEVEAEYQSLLRRFPDNPVYLMALSYRANGTRDRAGLVKIVRLAPEWSWAHYAQALLVKQSDPESAARELRQCINLDPSAIEAYELLIDLQERRLHRIDDAISTAEEFAEQTGIRPSVRLPELWRLRLAKANQSESARKVLKDDLARWANQTSDVDVLLAIRSAYLNLVPDNDSLRAVEDRIRRLDPSWTSQRGWVYTEARFDQSKVPRYVVLVNRQIQIREDAQKIAGAVEESDATRIHRLEKLLDEHPSRVMKRIIYEYIFQFAERSNDSARIKRYGYALYRIDPTDSGLLSRIALGVSNDPQEIKTALYFARKAYERTSQFRAARRPKNTPQSFFENLFPEQKQREAFERNRASTLDALGWVLVKMDQAGRGEPLLRQAVGMERTADRLSHLAKALEKLGRGEEASALKTESSQFLAESVRRRFTDDAVADFSVESIEGRRFSLSDLRGKVVIINFWATWCVPCIQEMPSLKRLYDKYRARGLEVLAVATDEDAAKIGAFVKDHPLSFSLVRDQSLSRQFGIEALPANLFVDRQGRIRYRKTGFEEADERELEAVVVELLK